MIVFFSRNLHEYHYILPVIKKTGGVLVTPSTDIMRLAEENNIKCKLGDISTIRNFKNAIIVVASHYLQLPRNAKKVQLFHGVAEKFYTYTKSNFKDANSILYWINYTIFLLPPPLSKLSIFHDNPYTPIRKLNLERFIKDRYDLLCIPGPYAEKKLKEKQILREDNWAKIGFPRFDDIVNKKINKEKLMEKFNISKDKKTILYAPTWSSRGHLCLSSLPYMGLDILKMAIDRGYNVIFRPHSLILKYNQFPKIIKKIKNMEKEFENIHFADSKIDILQYMLVSDLLITDYSSVGIEYLFFDKPIIYIRHLGDKYKGGQAERLVEKAGETVKDKKELEQKMDEIIAKPNAKKSYRNKLRDLFFYKIDGRASERARDAIISLLNEK